MAPTDSSEKRAIQNFVTNHRSGTHREFDMEPMPLSDDELVVLMTFQELHVSKTGGARKYFLLNVMYEISQRYWTLGEVEASYRAFAAKNYLSNPRKKKEIILQPQNADPEDLKMMFDIGILAMRMKEYGDKMVNKINSTSKLFYARIPDNDVDLLMGTTRKCRLILTKMKPLTFSDLTLKQILSLMSSQKKLRLS
jgi:hypothetical protein